MAQRGLSLAPSVCDESCDLVEITRVKFMEAQRARDWPPAIQYLSVRCDVSPLVLSSGSKEVTKVPVRGFLQIATTSWNSMRERWLPDFQWRPVRGGLCGIEEFEKAVAEIQNGTYHDGACPLWIEMLVQGKLEPSSLASAGTRQLWDLPKKGIADAGTLRCRDSPPAGLGAGGTRRRSASLPMAAGLASRSNSPRKRLADAGTRRRRDSPPPGLAAAWIRRRMDLPTKGLAAVGTRRCRDSPTQGLAVAGTCRRRDSTSPGLGVKRTRRSNASRPRELSAIGTRWHRDSQPPAWNSSRQGLGTYGTRCSESSWCNIVFPFILTLYNKSAGF